MRMTGALLILVGILVFISLWGLSEYHFKAGYVDAIKDKEITLKGEGNLLGDWGIIKRRQEVVIPCKYIFAVGAFIIVAGLFAVVLHHDSSRKR